MDIKKILLASLLSSTAIVGGCDLSDKKAATALKLAQDTHTLVENTREKAEEALNLVRNANGKPGPQGPKGRQEIKDLKDLKDRQEIKDLKDLKDRQEIKDLK
ncbi:hypothetical protein Q7M27_05350 (plasmid) [Candidatus Liberibacter asiaticus]